MIKNESIPQNIKFKKLERHQIKKLNIKKSKKNIINNKHNNSIGKTLQYIKDINNVVINKSINENYSNNVRPKSNMIFLSKSSNNFLNINKDKNVSKENNKIEINQDNSIHFNDNSKNKNRYLNCFEKSIPNISNKKDDNKITNLINDFIITNEYNNKENINILNNNVNFDTQINENNKEKTNFIIKVNKNNSFGPKKFYIQECLKLKNNIKNKITIEEPRKGHIHKNQTKNMVQKRNPTHIKKHDKKRLSIVDEDNNNNSNNNISENNCHSLYKILKNTNSFMLSHKNLLLNKNKDNFFTINKIGSGDTDNTYNIHNDKDKNSNKYTIKINKKGINSINSLDQNSIKNYEQRKIKVFKNKSPNSINNKKEDNNKNNIRYSDIINQKYRNIYKTISFNKDIKDINCNKKNKFKNLSLDFSLKDEKETDEKHNSHMFLLSPINRGISDDRKVYSPSKKRFIKKRSKKNIQIIDFDFDELNKKLGRMIQKLEKKDENKKCNYDNNKEGFIKWDAFEKEIGQEN